MKLISENTLNEIKKIKLQEKRQVLEFFNAIDAHFKNYQKLFYLKLNKEKLKTVDRKFRDFYEKKWGSKKVTQITTKVH